jgi:hypothetical protein
MKKISLNVLALSSALLATPEVNSLSEVFSEAKTSGNVKYYYIQTDKDQSYNSLKSDSSAYSNSIGGQLTFKTASLYGFRAGATFLTTNPFLLDGAVDTSIIGKDNGARGGNPDEGFSVLGEGYIAYKYEDLDFLYGRQVIKTPLIHAKEVRMLPSAVEGGFFNYKIDEKSGFTFAYLDKFKQRTSSSFINMQQHALGSKTEEIIGSTTGGVVMAGVDFKRESYSITAYDYYAQDFLNSFYIDAAYKVNISDVKLTLSTQYINQKSVGNADTNLENDLSLAGGSISVNAIGIKAVAIVKSAKLTLVYSNVLRDETKHDSLVLPWDGTPLFTNMITSNDLFQSIYGNALNSDSIYIGGSQGIKLAYNQKFDPLGLDGFSTTFTYLNTSNSRAGFDNRQQDYNVVLGYKADKAFSVALKGIWVQDNTSADAVGKVSQLKLLSQYRIIANYKF